MIERINNEKVIAHKASRVLLNGEFSIYLKTISDTCYFCNCERTSKGIRIITQTTVSLSQFERAFEKKAKPTPVKSPLISSLPYTPLKEKSISSSTPQNFFTDTRFFGSEKLHRVLKSELEELAQRIDNWVLKTSVPDDAIRKTHHYLQERFQAALTTAEIEEFTIALLKIRTEQFQAAVAVPIIEKQPKIVTPKPRKKPPTIILKAGSDICGQRLIKGDEATIYPAAKIGGYPDLPTETEATATLENYHFIAQINTQQVTNLPTNFPAGLLSIFASKAFDGTDYFKALPARIIHYNLENTFSPRDVGQAVLDTYFIQFEPLIVDEIDKQKDPIELYLSPQFLPSFHQDDYAEQLVTNAFKMQDERAFELLPEINGQSTLAMTPILRLNNWNLKIKGKSLYNGLNVVVFMPTEKLLEGDFSYCYFVVEH